MAMVTADPDELADLTLEPDAIGYDWVYIVETDLDKRTRAGQSPNDLAKLPQC